MGAPLCIEIMTEEFPFDDVERLEQEEDDLPEIPDWPSIIKPPDENIY